MQTIAVVAAAMGLSGCTDALLGPAPGTDRAALFDQVWEQFDLHYSFFEFKGVNWDSLGATYHPLAIAAGSDAAFAAQIGEMMRELKDVHVSLTPAGAGSTVGYVSVYDTIATYFNPAIVDVYYLTREAATSGRHLTYGLAAPAVGYVRISSFAGESWDGEMDEALGAMPQITSVIIDVRNNPGGNNTLAVQLAGRFTATTRRYGWVRLRNGPKHTDFTDFIERTVAPLGARAFAGAVYILTNRRDFSSAEDFVLAMRALPKVTVVGDTTAGASGGPLSRELTNGWSYELSEWIEYLPGKKMFEGVGLAPDEYVKAAARDASRGVDAAMAKAVALAR
jgi:carboxyl-terminal processing protease